MSGLTFKNCYCCSKKMAALRTGLNRLLNKSLVYVTPKSILRTTVCGEYVFIKSLLSRWLCSLGLPQNYCISPNGVVQNFNRGPSSVLNITLCSESVLDYSFILYFEHELGSKSNSKTVTGWNCCLN